MMPTIIKCDGIEARYDHGWECEDPFWLSLLQSQERYLRSSGIYSPNWGETLANAAAKELGAEVIEVPETESEPGKVY